MFNLFDKCKNTILNMYAGNNWNESSGLSAEELKIGCDRIFSCLTDFGVSRTRSELMAYILENAMLEVCPDDFFADKINHNGILGTYLWKSLVPAITKPVNESVTDAMPLISCVAIEASTDFGHIAPDWSFLIEYGITGVIDRLEKYRNEKISKGEDVSYYDDCLRVYRAIIVYMKRLAKLCREYDSVKMHFVADNLEALTLHAPETLAQAMQLTIVIYTLQTFLENANVRSLGGLDRLYLKFYRNDKENGRFTEEQLRELIRYFFIKLSGMKVAANTPFYICGRNPDGTDATNELTYVLLEEYAKLGVYDPKIHVLYHFNVPRRLTNMILELIHNGTNSFVFLNADLAERALCKIGIDKEDAKKVIVYGCYETASEGEEVPSTCAGRINMPKILELFLNYGASFDNTAELSKKPSGVYSDFNDFFNAFKEFLCYCVRVCMDTISGYEVNYRNAFSAPILSATFKSSVQKGLDVFYGGAKYNNTSIVCSCLATVADSLAIVKRMVYDKKERTYDELLRILKSNWEGEEKLRLRCASDPCKFANNNSEVDYIAADICDCLAKQINGYPNSRGGIFRFGMFSIDYRFRFGRVTGALPDGRFAGEPMSKNFSATVGNDRSGVTAFLNSVLKVKGEDIPDGCVADVVLHSSATRGDEGLTAMHSLLDSFISRGGFAIQFNVTNSELLRKAQTEPDKYKNLQIRVCGWNSRFISLSKAEQDEFIAQSENV